VLKKTFVIKRRTSSVGKVVTTYCRLCKTMHRVTAGPAPG
jgi:hypothetical protein